MKEEVISHTDNSAHGPPHTWTWPADVNSVRERFIADTVASNLRHEVLNLVTSMGNACYLLKRQAAHTKPDAEGPPLLDHLVRNVAAISRAMDVRYVAPPDDGTGCGVADELERLALDVVAPAPWTVATTPELLAATIAMPREEFRAAVSCAVEALSFPGTHPGPVTLSLAAKDGTAVTLTASMARTECHDIPSGAQERHSPPWFDVARRIVMRRGGSAHSHAPGTIALTFQR